MARNLEIIQSDKTQEDFMSTILAFDVYGTLIDTQGILSKLEKIVGAKGKEFSHAWREKQLEYSFSRGLMQNYKISLYAIGKPLTTHVNTTKFNSQKNKSMNYLMIIGNFPHSKTWKMDWLV